ncbi:AAA family ATPase [Cystobacter fuscus]|uniref:AAA family ATPase n=1 Tax=Cystobacter fuscus TaxID=43 RepID=UPI002B2A9B47|nr:AAA family ATPase [Cystobacter fuscus]
MKGGLRVELLRVQGFGHFSDYELELRPGLNLLYGPNEAGKSTLLAFLRGMLFGFDKKGRAESRYEPEVGARAGELFVSAATGSLVVKRIKKTVKVLDAQGQELSASRLDEALAHVSRELFCEVFAFGLDELSSFERLSQEDGVSRALFAAGLRGARRLPEVEKHLETRAGEIFKKTGKIPELNQVLLRLEEVRQQLGELKDRPARYFQERERLLSLGREREETQRLLETCTRDLRRLSRLEEALGDLSTLARLDEEWARLPDLSSFPSEGVPRLEALLQRGKALQAEQSRLEALLGAVEEERGQLSSATLTREREEALRSAWGAFTARAELLRALPGRRSALDARRQDVERAVEGLGLEVDLTGLLSLELGAAARGTLESLAERLSKAEGERREAEVALVRARGERERIVSSLTRLQAERARLPDVSAAELRQRQVALGRVKLLRMEREQVVAQRTELQQRLQSLRASSEPEPGAAPSPLGMWLGVGLAVVLVLGVGVSSGAVAGALATLGALLLAVPLMLGHQGAVRTHQRMAEAHAARQRQHAQEMARVQSALDALMGRRVAVERELALAASEAGVAADDPVAGLALVEASLADALRQAERVEHLGREREGRQAEADAAGREVQAAELAGRRAEMQVRTLRGELSLVLDARGFPSNLSAQRALELWRDAAEQRRRLVELNVEERALAADESGCEAVVARLYEEARAVGLPEGGSVEALASRVASALEEHKAREARLRELRARAEDLGGEWARLSRLREAEAREVEALLAQGGADSEESFRQRARRAERFEELTGQRRELRSRVEAATGLTAEVARAAIEAEGGEERLRERLGQLRIQEPAHARRLEQLHTDYGAARSQLERWEGDEELARLRTQEERLRARAAELATRYAKDRLALALLARARRRFEQEQQPRVIQLASEHFAALTEGRYRRVFVPAGGSRELRVTGARRDWSPEELSRGTREQLYLAFRLAVIQDFGETRGALPLMVDDILVNFDPRRARGTLELLARLSTHHQVIAFTCHPWLRELFEDKGARVVELPARGEAAASRRDSSDEVAPVVRWVVNR